METTFYKFGILYLRWEKEGHVIEAVKEQVDFWGKECFEDFRDPDIMEGQLIAYGTMAKKIKDTGTLAEKYGWKTAENPLEKVTDEEWEEIINL